jgi:hypothetical protein
VGWGNSANGAIRQVQNYDPSNVIFKVVPLISELTYDQQPLTEANSFDDDDKTEISSCPKPAS